MIYRYQLDGKSYLFTGADLEYVRGGRDNLPGKRTTEERYVAACARQEFAKLRKEAHRASMQGILTVVSNTPSS